MATTQEFADKVCRRMAPFGDVRSRKMFGEYMVYVNERPVLTLCDNRVFVKKLPQVAVPAINLVSGITMTIKITNGKLLKILTRISKIV